MKLCILMFCVALVASFPSHAQFAYSTNPDGTVTITNYTGPEGPLQIPQSLESMQVTAIGSTAFKASLVTRVTIPDSVLEIGPEAFSECPLLRDVSIGSGLTYLSDNPFLGCASLTNIVVDSRNRFYSSTDGVLIKKEQKQIVAYPSGRKGTYIVPEDLTSTSYDAFKGCARLSGFIGSDSIVSIGSFSDCTALTNVVLGNMINYIPYEGFMRCRSLKGFDIPDSVSSIEPRTFAGCSSLERLVIGRNMTNT